MFSGGKSATFYLKQGVASAEACNAVASTTQGRVRANVNGGDNGEVLAQRWCAGNGPDTRTVESTNDNANQ